MALHIFSDLISRGAAAASIVTISYFYGEHMQIRNKTPPWDVPMRAHSQKRQSAQSNSLNMTPVTVSVKLMDPISSPMVTKA